MFVSSLAACVPLVLPQSPQFTSDVHRAIPDVGEPPSGTALGDVDGDGDLDLVHARRLWLGDGAGRFVERPASLPALDTTAPRVYSFADFDADLDLDLVSAGHGLDFVWLNDGAGGFVSDVRALPRSPSIFSQFGCGYDATIAAEVGDIDGDGDLDLVLGDASSDCELGCCTWGIVRWLANDGTGNFVDRTHSLPMALITTDVSALELADFDGDDDLDLALMRSGSTFGEDAVFLNDGHGEFGELAGALPHQAYSAGAVLRAFDAEGDGDLDLAFGHAGLSLFVNDGSGRFTAANQHLPPLGANYVRGLAPRDVDADGDVDLLLGALWCSASDGSTSALFANDGTGRFSDASDRLPVGTSSVTALELGDLDGDGDFDAIPSLATNATVWLADDAGRFTAWSGLVPAFADYITYAAAAGDLDADGDLDLVAEGHGALRVFLSDGSGALTQGVAPTPSDGYETLSLALGDVDRDGDLDLVTANDFGPERLYLNDGHASFAESPGKLVTPDDRTDRVLLADFDGDQDLDLFSGARLDVAKVHVNDGNGDFTWRPELWPGHFDVVVDAFAGDFDGDHDVDLWLQNQGARLYTNDGHGDFTERPAFPGTEQAWSNAAGDVDGDGDLDVLVLASSGSAVQRLRLYLNDGTATFTDASAQLPDVQIDFPGRFELADIEPDGDPDVLLAGPAALENDGHGRFGPPRALTERPLPGLPALARDFDFDGDHDILLAPGYAEFRLLKNRATHLAWLAPPRPGRELAFELAGTPHAALVLFGATELEPTGSRASSFVLQRSTIFFRRAVQLDGEGRGFTSFVVPDDPALVGLTHFWQAVELAPDRVTNLEVATYGAY
ncbi:MAG: VCBS repeat-containing protein [Planctomycetes bacterium]|nr:VCBS repeat-containing protein [Planctomycetota bacterium]